MLPRCNAFGAILPIGTSPIGIGESPHVLAKLTPPRLYQPVPRERLFRLLDRREHQPLVWISGPPGAGKSTLVASYLERRELESAWIQLDSGDRDPATLFFYLRELVSRSNPEQANGLPHLTAEYAADVPGFARRCFRKLFDALGETAALVFDNCQDAVGADFDAILRAAVEETPPGKCIMILSRSEIPAALARLRVMNLVATINWQDLRFTAEESAQLASLRGIDEVNTVAAIADRADGWVAGLAAMLASVSAGQQPPAKMLARDSKEMLFDFFAGEVFERLAPPDREFLLRTALLPQMTVTIAEQVCGRDDARQILERLYRNQYFTTRHSENEATYQYHSLFREFLLARLEESATPDALAEFRRRAASVLAAHEQSEPAIDLLLDAADFSATAPLIRDAAEGLIAHGRAAMVLTWLARFPAEWLAGDPWLSYWHGMALLNVDPKAAEKCLERAHAGFVTVGDARGRFLTAQAAIWAIGFQLGSYQPIDRWLAELQHLLEERVVTANEQETTTAWYVFLPLATIRDPRNASIPTAVARLRPKLADSTLSKELRLQIGTALLAYAWSSGDAQLCQQSMSVAGALAESEDVSPATRCDYLCNGEGWYWFSVGNYLESMKRFERAAVIARDYKLLPFELAARAFGAVLAVVARQYEIADQELDALSAITGFEQFLATRMLSKGRALSHWQQGRLDDAYRLVAPTIEGIDACGLIDGCASIRFDMAAICVDVKDFATARRLIDEAKQMLAGSVIHFADAHAEGVEAYLALREGRRDDMIKALQVALPLLKNPSMRGQFLVLAQCVPILFNEALEVGIETDLVKQLIREFKVSAPENASDDWPWPVAIRALGGFEVRIDGEPLSFAGRVHYRVLQLLKAIVAFGGRNVSVERLADALWPDADGDAAANSLRTTLHRLRRLLGYDEAVLLCDGKLSLNPAACSLDWWALHSLGEQLERQHGQALDEAICARALKLYRGPLLDNENEDWMVGPRQQARTEYLSLLRELGQRLEVDAKAELAVRIYEKSIAVDPAAELPRVRLMLCLRALQRTDEAIQVYEHYERVYNAARRSPSAEMRRIYDSLRLS